VFLSHGFVDAAVIAQCWGDDRNYHRQAVSTEHVRIMGERNLCSLPVHPEEKL